MITETQIAKENVSRIEDTGNLDLKSSLIRMFRNVCKEHLATCQRFLKAFKDELRKDIITDLQNAIKTYEDAGIK